MVVWTVEFVIPMQIINVMGAQLYNKLWGGGYIVLKFTKNGFLKKYIYRIMYWQIEPLLSQICELRNIQGIEAVQESMNNMS